MAIEPANFREIRQKREMLRKCIDVLFSQYDYLITPALPTLPWYACSFVWCEMMFIYYRSIAELYPSGFDVFNWNPYLPIANICGLAAASIPIGRVVPLVKGKEVKD
jgi:Asp-tRNA(Asn)/Glu-tRNA(Gln) amidotransferase A subunit family amidase